MVSILQPCNKFEDANCDLKIQAHITLKFNYYQHSIGYHNLWFPICCWLGLKLAAASVSIQIITFSNRRQIQLRNPLTTKNTKGRNTKGTKTTSLKGHGEKCWWLMGIASLRSQWPHIYKDSSREKWPKAPHLGGWGVANRGVDTEGNNNHPATN